MSFVVKSPKSSALDVIDIVIKSTILTVGHFTVPPSNIPLVFDATADAALLACVKSPKSVAPPAVAIVINQSSVT